MKTVNPRVVLVALLALASFSSLSNGLTINGVKIGTVRINGLLFCSVNGNFIGNSPPLSNVNVVLKCNGANTDLGQALTNTAGAYTVAVKIADTLLFDPSICFITIRLPVATCSALPPDGILRASINLVNVVQSGLDNIANFATGAFVHSVL